MCALIWSLIIHPTRTGKKQQTGRKHLLIFKKKNLLFVLNPKQQKPYVQVKYHLVGSVSWNISVRWFLNLKSSQIIFGPTDVKCLKGWLYIWSTILKLFISPQGNEVAFDLIRRWLELQWGGRGLKLQLAETHGLFVFTSGGSPALWSTVTVNLATRDKKGKKKVRAAAMGSVMSRHGSAVG